MVLSVKPFWEYDVAMYSTVSPILFGCFLDLVSRKTLMLFHFEMFQGLFGGDQKGGIHTVSQEDERC